MLKVCKCKYIVRREILVVKEKFVFLSQEMMNELQKQKKKKKKRKEENEYEKKMNDAIRLGVQRINLR